MKKILIGILTIMLIGLLYVVIAKGLSLAGIQIGSVESIKSANGELSAKIEAGNKITKQTYKQSLETLQTSIQELTTAKGDYESKTHYAEGEEPIGVVPTNVYEVETLMVWIGDYIEEYGLNVRMNLTAGTIAGAYNLTFEADGSYIDITEFISELENDERLNFKIEDFTMARGGSSAPSTPVAAQTTTTGTATTDSTNQAGTGATTSAGSTATTTAAEGSDTTSLRATFKVTNINVILNSGTSGSEGQETGEGTTQSGTEGGTAVTENTTVTEEMANPVSEGEVKND